MAGSRCWKKRDDGHYAVIAKGVQYHMVKFEARRHSGRAYGWYIFRNHTGNEPILGPVHTKKQAEREFDSVIDQADSAED